MSDAPQQGSGAPCRPDLARFIMMALIAPCLLVIFAVWLGQQYYATEAMRRETRAAFEVSLEASSIIARISDAESSQRGYVLTGDPKFLASYASAREAAMATLNQLNIGFAGDAGGEALAKMRILTVRRFGELDDVIHDRRVHGLASAAALVRNRVDQSLMGRMRYLSDAIIASTQQEREARSRRYGNRFHRDAIWIATGIGTVGILLTIAAVTFWRQRMSEYRAQMATYGTAERNRAILQSTVDGIVIIDPSGRIETANAAAAEILGYRAEELIGRDFCTFVLPSDGTVPSHQHIEMRDGHIAQPHLPDRKVLRSDGRAIPVDMTLGIMRLPDGDHFVASLHDISERKQLERIKDELVSTVSHELRTPLTSIVGALGLLRSGATGVIDPAPARLIEIAENNSRRLIRLINDMLDIDRIQSGQWEFASERTDLRDVVDRACEGSQGQSGAADVEIECTMPEAPVEVSGDADRLLQVLTNLASNAIRVSRRGQKIRIGVTATERGKAIVTVDDDGPGIPIEFRDRIFGRFERAERGHGIGTGLGLAISREIVIRHGGRIWFEDRPGGGTRFAFSLDLLASPTIVATAPYRWRLLICEDDPDIAETLRLMVDGLGFDAECVGTIAATRAALQTASYHVLLLDMKLPDETGSSLLRSLRASDGTLPLPVIIISAEPPRGRSNALLRGDIVDWIEKPVDAKRLAAALRTATANMRVAA